MGLNVSGDVTSVNGRAGAVILDKDDVNLSEVDNTADADKPLSDAAVEALDGVLKVKLLTHTIAANVNEVSTPFSMGTIPAGARIMGFTAYVDLESNTSSGAFSFGDSTVPDSFIISTDVAFQKLTLHMSANSPHLGVLLASPLEVIATVTSATDLAQGVVLKAVAIYKEG